MNTAGRSLGQREKSRKYGTKKDHDRGERWTQGRAGRTERTDGRSVQRRRRAARLWRVARGRDGDGAVLFIIFRVCVCGNEMEKCVFNSAESAARTRRDAWLLQ